jgi:hypothetical protein
MPRGRPKLSNEAKAKNRKETYRKYNAKRGLNQHPNAFANLATSALREQYIKELEDDMMQSRISESKDDEIDYDPDEDFKGLELDDDENMDRFDGENDGMNVEEDQLNSAMVIDMVNRSSSSSSSINPSRDFILSNIHFIRSILTIS